jgi:hypothetical protein
MDHESFDRLVRLLGRAGSRRAALGALLGASSLGVLGEALGKGKGKGRKDRGKSRNKDRGKTDRKAAPAAPPDGAVAVEATCGSPGPSSNLSGCNFNGRNLAGVDLSSSNMKNARFNGANLCGADLSSSTLTNVDFRNANLTKADLHSSGCNGIQTNAGTTFCQTIMCNGTVRSDDCPGAAPNTVCCAAANCAARECRTAACSDSLCAYAMQPDGDPGTLCPAPRECCDGGCCPAGQKCCDGDCIPNATCCPADCGPNQKCCGSGCIADNVCCTNGTSGTCPPGQQCCVDQGTGFPLDDDGGTCKQAIGQTCRDTHHPELDCCFPDFCCKNANDAGPECKAGSGKACIGNDDCCNDAGFFCGTNGICCLPNEGDRFCSDVSPCCPGLVCEDSECVADD